MLRAAQPSSTKARSGGESGLSQSDNIAIGLGIGNGIGLPAIIAR